MEEAAASLEDFRSDVEDVYRVIEVGPATSERAIEVARDHRLRAYDCLQLATALLLEGQRARAGLEPLTLVSSDGELNVAAEAEGITVEDPAVH